MTASAWLQLALFVAALVALTKPMGRWLVAAMDPAGRTYLDPVLRPIERLLYRLLGVDPAHDQNWRQYAASLLWFSVLSGLFSFVILRFQHLLPLNPQHFGPLSWDLAFNTSVSFLTNTNWQSYAGETTMSYLSQMVALASHNFWSAATGLAVAAALVRGLARDKAATIGNFWVDLVRANLFVLVPLSLVMAIFLLSQGVIQNFGAYQSAAMVEGVQGGTPRTQTIAQGPVASQVAIKMLGTNGGGFFNANAAHPYENPTPLSNFVQMLAIFLIPSGLTWFLGRNLRDQGHGWTIWAAMFALFLAGVLICWFAEARGNPRLAALGIDASSGNMEGKETRFGVFNSVLFATVTTDASCGAVNCMHDSLTPLGGMVPVVNMQLGEVVFGGVGAGLYGMLVVVIVTIFLAGLMVGRTPEYAGKKLEAFDVKMAVLALLVPVFAILGLSAWAVRAPWGLAGLNNIGPHGLTEILYAFTSAANNNGSAFAGLSANTPWYNVTLAVAMLIGRFGIIIPVLALAGHLAGKKLLPRSAGNFPLSGLMFGGLVVATVLIVGALMYMPVLCLSPVIEHLQMLFSAKTF